MSESRANIFTYGTLVFDEIWSKIVHGRYERTVARLPGYLRRLVRGTVYPAVIPGGLSDAVPGVLYRHVTTPDIKRLDAFEGRYYLRRREECIADGGERLAAFVYVFREQYRGLLDEKDWDPAWFVREGMAGFISEYEGFLQAAE